MKWGRRTWSSSNVRTLDKWKLARIVNDAAIASQGTREGRLIPLVILDAVDRPDIVELIRVHGSLAPRLGDLVTSWGHRRARGANVVLSFEFLRPVVNSLILEFDIVHQAMLVDLIVRSHSLYLQAGRDGDRFMTTPDAAKLLVDVNAQEFSPIWEGLLLRELTDRFRKDGFKRSLARDAARDFLTEMRRFSDTRMPPLHGQQPR